MRRMGPPSRDAAMDGAGAVIRIGSSEVTIEAEYLADKLGLSAEQLQIEMRRGAVQGAVERGVGEDAGRLRLNFRYRTRAWALIVEPDGTLNEASSLVIGHDVGTGQDGADQ
jgi:hypothetical protein